MTIERLLNIEELSEILGIAKATIYSWTSQHMIPHIKIGKRLLKFRESEILEWLSKRSYNTDALKSVSRNRPKKSSAKSSASDDYVERIIHNAKEEVLRD